MQGGIYNAALFGASQRDARNKLDRMAGITRSGPSGILASSTELMQAAMPAQRAMTPVQPMPQMMPMVQPAFPQVPMQTAVAPMQAPVQQPVRQAAPAPSTSVPAPQNPIRLQEGGEVEAPQQPQPVDITRTPRANDDIMSQIMGLINRSGEWLGEAIVSTYGTGEAARRAAAERRQNIEEAAATGDARQTSDIVLREAGETPTPEAKQDFARTVLGIDTDDISAIDDAIFNTLTADVSLSGDRLQQAVLLGLQNYKQTAVARAAGSGGGSNMSPLEPFPDAVRDLAGKIMTATGEDPAVAIQQARDALLPYYTGQATGAPVAAPQAAGTDEMPTTPGTRFRDNETGKIMVVGEDGVAREE